MEDSTSVYIPDVQVHRAGTLEEASGLMARYGPDARLLAGGTDLLVDLKTGRASARHLVSINRVEGLRGVSADADRLRIGALTTITELAEAQPVHERFAPILEATRDMASPQVRNLATVGGNIASAVPCADLPPILMVLGASAVLWSPTGERKIPLDAFFLGPRRTALRTGEVLTAVEVPAMRARHGAAYARLALRNGNAIAVASVAAGLLLENGTTREARIVLGAVAPIPKPVESASAILAGKFPDEEAFEAAARAAAEEAEPISDVRGSADYRRKAVAVLTRRALAAALRMAKETAA
jgi:carbon-monoxide dehydrogenase medium subunit